MRATPAVAAGGGFILAMLVLLCSTVGTAFGQDDPCLIHDWLNVTRCSVTTEKDTVIVSAELVSLDARNPVDFYEYWEDPRVAWVFDGYMRINTEPAYGLGGGHLKQEVRISAPYPSYAVLYDSPLTLTPTKFEFRFPANILVPGHYEYRVGFGEMITHTSDCFFAFTGTLDIGNTTPTARHSFGQVKALWK